ncbi:hypothetical protein S245_037439, partial [Arachis hypogaea]
NSTDPALQPTRPASPNVRSAHHPALAVVMGPNSCVIDHTHHYSQYTARTCFEFDLLRTILIGKK